MPRTGDLLTLSREHHTALVLGRAAKKAIESRDDDVIHATIAKIQGHWRDVMAAHFAKEEQLIQAASGNIDHELMVRIFADHAALKMLSSESCKLDAIERLQRFADLIVMHVRFEERIVFPQLQYFLDSIGISRK